MTDEQYKSEDRERVSGGLSLRFVCGRRRVIVHVLCERVGQLTAATKGLMMHFKPGISIVGVTWPEPLVVLLARQSGVEGRCAIPCRGTSQSFALAWVCLSAR